jgi:hypothetical protein
MRNDSMTSTSRHTSNIHAHKHLGRVAAQVANRPLRKIRDLIIFREYSAQKRNNRRDSPLALNSLRPHSE